MTPGIVITLIICITLVTLTTIVCSCRVAEKEKTAETIVKKILENNKKE